MTSTGSASASTVMEVPSPASLPKALTGIWGLDEVTGGGLPRGRPTLVTGTAGCGKTLLGIEFLVHGALDFGEPGVLMSFEESADDVAANVLSLGFDLKQMEADQLLVVDAVQLDPAEFIETGAYDLDGLFVRLAYAVDSIGAKRVVLDTIEVLFGALPDEATIRSELGRLFRWMKERGLTVVVTGEKGAGALTRHGVEEYVSDCVIVLDHRTHEEQSTRRLRVVKYRGSVHGTNEYPFLITDRGITVLPLSALGLNYEASTERVSTGVPRLDHQLGGGVFRGSSTLITGGAGTGKTTLTARMVEAGCERGERALFVSFEESPAQLLRNMTSVGIDLGRWVDTGLLRLWAGRPSAFGLERHLAELLREVQEFGPTLVVLDALTALTHVGDPAEVTSAMTRELDVLKARGITAVTTSLTHDDSGVGAETSSVMITSLVDTWLLLRNTESNGERNRLLFVRKSRGTAHSNQVREFVLRSDGIELLDVYVGAQGVLTGSARLSQEAADRRAKASRSDELHQRRRALARRTAEVEAQYGAMRAELGAELEGLVADAVQHDVDLAAEETLMGRHRWADPESRAATPEANSDDPR